MATGAHQTDEPLPSALPPVTDESVVLASVDGTSEREPMNVRLTWSFLGLVPTRRPRETRWIPLGFLTAVSAEKAPTGEAPGDLRIGIHGPGYVGPSLYLIRGMPAVHRLRAAVLRQRAITTGIPASAG